MCVSCCVLFVLCVFSLMLVRAVCGCVACCVVSCCVVSVVRCRIVCVVLVLCAFLCCCVFSCFFFFFKSGVFVLMCFFLRVA